MDLGLLLDTCSWYDKWQFFADLFDYNIWPNSALLRDIRLRNMSHPEFDLSRSPRVKCDSVFGLAIYAFSLMFNSIIWPNYALLHDKRGWQSE